MSFIGSLSFLIQSEIEKLKAENDRLKSENQGSCSRAQSQVSISSSPRQSMGLSQHSLNLTESASLGEYMWQAMSKFHPVAIKKLKALEQILPLQYQKHELFCVLRVQFSMHDFSYPQFYLALRSAYFLKIFLKEEITNVDFF